MVFRRLTLQSDRASEIDDPSRRLSVLDKVPPDHVREYDIRIARVLGKPLPCLAWIKQEPFVERILTNETNLRLGVDSQNLRARRIDLVR